MPHARVLALAACAIGCAPRPLLPAAAAEPPPVAERPVQRARVGAIELAWDSFGAVEAPPVLLIMGLGLQMIGWEEAFCERLAARGLRVIRFDNRDVGLSTHLDAAGDPEPLRVWDELRRRRPVEPPYRIADMADDAAGLVDALGLGAAHVVGLSLGGMIAQELAIRHPGKVLTLTSIMSTTGERDVKGPSFEVLAALARPFPRDRPGFIARAVELARTLAGPAHPIDEAKARRLAGRAYDRSWDQPGGHRQLVAIWTSPGRRAALAGVRVPALVIHGDADPLVPVEGGRDTARAIPGARLEIIPGMGHVLPESAWPRVIDAIARLAGR